MIPAEAASQIRRIEIQTRKLVTEVFSGRYESVFKGRGMEFAEVREYLPGDDVKTIDWNVTARYGRPFIKKFVEERELTVVLAVDLSGSGSFGSHRKTKNRLASEVAAVLTFSAMHNNDRVGMLIFTDRVEKFIPARKGRRHALRLISEILCHRPQGRGTDIGRALRYLNDVVRRRAVVFLLSDFMDRDFEKLLSATNRRHDLVAITITDPREGEMPAAGLVRMQDNESGRIMVVDTSDPLFRRAYQERAAIAHAGLTRQLAAAGVDHVDLATDQPYVTPLRSFFEMRARRLRRQTG